MQDVSPVSITKTQAGMTPREIAVAVIADKLLIRTTEVSDTTHLGNAFHDITMVIALKTGKILIGNVNMTAKDVFDQL